MLIQEFEIIMKDIESKKLTAVIKNIKVDSYRIIDIADVVVITKGLKTHYISLASISHIKAINTMPENII